MSSKSGLIDPNKPLVKQLGENYDVVLENESLVVDKSANDLIHKIGQSHCPPDLNYVGTISVHLYVDKMVLAKEAYNIASITNIAMKENISEALVATALNNMTINVRTHFNPAYKHKSNNKNDKRGEVK